TLVESGAPSGPPTRVVRLTMVLSCDWNWFIGASETAIGFEGSPGKIGPMLAGLAVTVTYSGPPVLSKNPPASDSGTGVVVPLAKLTQALGELPMLHPV